MPDPGPPDGLPRGFGPATATFVVVASMIGGGILTTSGLAVANVGGHPAMLGLWALGGLLALCGALTLAELSAALPRAGGEYAILAEAYGPLAAFVSGWVSLLLGFAAPIAATASASSRYLLAPFGESASDGADRWIASAAIIGLSVVHALGRRWTSRVQGFVTVSTLAALSAFVVAGLIAGRAGWSHLRTGPIPPALPTLFSMIYVVYSYTGWNAASYIAAEIRDAPRQLPRAIAIGTGLVVVLYLGLNLVYALAIPAPELIAMEKARGPSAVEPIAEIAAGRLFGPSWGSRISTGFALILLGSLGALLLTGPRVAFAMARSGQLPKALGRLSGRGQTPIAASATLSGVALGLLWTGRFEALVVYSGVGLSLFSMLTIASIFVLRRRDSGLPGTFRTPLYPLVPAVYLAMTAALSAAAFARRPTESLLALGSILAGIPLYFLAIRARQDAA